MNPEEGELRPQLLDRFGLCVDVEGIRDLDQRVAIVEKRAVWEDDPNLFYQQHAESEQAVKSQISEAIATFPEVMLPRVRRFLFCGETLTPQTAAHLLKRFPRAQVWNTYGPTEATVATTSIRIDAGILEQYSPLPVGHPMPGSEIFIVNGNREVLPANQRGEIIIAGPNVSPGYLARPDLTADAFFQYRGQRAYRTGDFGRFRDNLLFFEGRMDEQIKLSGYRIELGDVEANLRALATVRDAVVVPIIKDGAAQSLAAFVLLAARDKASHFNLSHGLRKQLSERLPAYMLPRKFVFLDAFPMTPNGKVDRASLAKSL